MGRTNSQLSGGGSGTYETNWNDLTALTLGELSANPYEITIPPAITSLNQMFAGWTTNLTKLKNDIIVHKSTGSAITNLNQAFGQSNNYAREITIDFDTSAVTDWTYCFKLGGAATYAKITINGTLDFTSATNLSSYPIFNGFIYREGNYSTFTVAEGSIYVSLQLSGCNPDDDTLQSIIDGLADLTGGTAQTLTLNSNVSARLTAEQIATITAKNWNLA